MKKILIFIGFIFWTVISTMSHPIDNYKFVVILHQEEAAKDIEPRMIKEFSNLGFTVLSEEEVAELDEPAKNELLKAKYRCRQSG